MQPEEEVAGRHGRVLGRPRRVPRRIGGVEGVLDGHEEGRRAEELAVWWRWEGTKGACVSAGRSGGRAKGGGVAFILTCAVAYTTSHVPSCAVVSKFSCCCARSASMMRLASSARSLYSRLICPRSVVAAILVVWATTSSMSERVCV